jgi:hypothetical protein
MKGSVLAISPLVSAALLASACATTSRPPAMPEWSAPESAAVVASAPFDVDDEGMRVPRKGEKEKLWQAQGLYLGGEIITAQPLGDFDDGLTLVSPNTDLLLVPDLDVGPGVGIYLSYRWRMDEVVLQGSVTEHDGDFSNPSRDLDTRLINLDLNWRHYFWEHSPMQPYGLLGIGMSRAEIDDGATDQTLTQVEDGYLKEGININVGAGIAIYTLPWVMFYGQAMYRFNRYKTAEGITEELSINGDIDGDTFLLSVGAAFRLSPPRN